MPKKFSRNLSKIDQNILYYVMPDDFLKAEKIIYFSTYFHSVHSSCIFLKVFSKAFHQFQMSKLHYTKGLINSPNMRPAVLKRQTSYWTSGTLSIIISSQLYLCGPLNLFLTWGTKWFKQAIQCTNKPTIKL